MSAHYDIRLTDALDPSRAAKVFMSEHGDQAAGRAAQRITELSRRGDVAGSARWLDIAAEINRLLAHKAPAGSAVH